MDSSRIERSVAHTARVSSQRVRKRNMAERRLLDHRLVELEQTHRHTQSAANSVIYSIQREIHLDNSSHSKDRTDTLTCFTRPLSGWTQASSRVGTPVVRWKAKPDKDLRPRCRWSINGERCRVFPCVAPSHYSSIGSLDGDSLGSYSSSYTGSSLSTGSLSQFELEQHSVRRPLRFYRTHTAHREKALRLNMDQLRAKNETTKPIDWATNYGKPVSLRRRHRIARARSAEVWSACAPQQLRFR